MEKLAADLQKLREEFALLRQELQLVTATTARTALEVTEIHSLTEDVGQKLDIIDARPLTNPTPKARSTKRPAIASTPVITDTTIPPVVDQAATPTATPRPAIQAQAVAKQEAKKFNRKTYFAFRYKQDKHCFDSCLDAETLATIPAEEPARSTMMYKLLSEDPEMGEWLAAQAKQASQAVPTATTTLAANPATVTPAT